MAASKLYDDLRTWWPLFSNADDYAAEARALRDAIPATAGQSLLAIGSGAGSYAFHLRHWFEPILTDIDPRILEVSKVVNPGCEHVIADMRSMRLGRQFDVVLVYHSIDAMKTDADFHRALETAALHAKPGGGVLVAPDWIRETFQPATICGGRDAGPRGLRYIQWRLDPVPDDDTYDAHFVYLLRDGDIVSDERHSYRFALRSRAAWLDGLSAVGLVPRCIASDLRSDLFWADKPA